MTADLSPRRRVALGAALAAILALALAHAALYAFLCDDAFISFRYAHNLAAGSGLVFNPGLERVEGYTNFLWVLILALVERVAGTPPERAASPLLLAATVALWALVARFALNGRREGHPLWPALAAPLFLAATRSFAVWSTSGLETRLFEVLVVAGALRLTGEVEAAVEAHREPRPWSALLFALATLTRPDGLLVAAACLATAQIVRIAARRWSARAALAQGAVFVAVVGAHVLWRRWYYGAWLPNTYYAKVGGRSWWDMGAAYLGSFTLEYALWLLVPLLVLGVAANARRGRAHVPAIFAAAVIPHAVYIASIGGDHFEYRPLDLYLPFLYLLAADGLTKIARGPRGRWLAPACAAACLAGIVAIPWRSHVEAPKEYTVGFPGVSFSRGGRSDFLDPSRDPIYRWPGLRWIAGRHRDLVRKTTAQFVGIRQEEHVLFLGTVVPQGRRLRSLVERGLIPSDTHIATSCVGAIPYYSGLPTLDRLGLTDAVVARSAPSGRRVMAHDKHATIEYARRIGVDLWAVDPVHLVWPLTDDRVVWYLTEARASGETVWFAEAGDGALLLVLLPQGPEAAARRMPRLTLRSSDDEGAWRALVLRLVEIRRQEAALHPESKDARLALGTALSEAGRSDEAESIFRALAGEGSADAWYNVGTIEARTGRLDAAVASFEQALRLDPSSVPSMYNLGLALGKKERYVEAAAVLRRAVDTNPSSAKALYALGVVSVATGDRATALRCAADLRTFETDAQDAQAARLYAALGTAPPGR